MSLLVAHRAGNHPETAARAVGRADMIELDVHVFRGRVEVRHEKILWPTARRWERWYLLPKDGSPPVIAEILKTMGPGTPLQLDLKCFTRRAARRIRASVPSTHPVVVSSRSWWIISVFKERPGTTMLRSCGSRWQLLFATLVPGLGSRVGIVAHERLLDRAAVEAVRSKTPHLFSWAITTTERGQELVDAGVTGLIVDDLELDWARPN